jgi:hypothetical protein
MNPGTLIHGTLRTQDLIERFKDELDSLGRGYATEWNDICDLMNSTGYTDDSGEVSEDWYDTETASEVLEMLFDALDSASADGYYFGAHPGDGSDFGYWEVESD